MPPPKFPFTNPPIPTDSQYLPKLLQKDPAEQQRKDEERRLQFRNIIMAEINKAREAKTKQLEGEIELHFKRLREGLREDFEAKREEKNKETSEKMRRFFEDAMKGL
ncbi:hypothetical protein HYFRA_00012088 [Hymenoscyphus fraxineus]|uniref:Uncharacterized protein n=1 Tax=Hymenoscyphus fraxineus TaxID=746836 RepID=A0A9N9KYA0_9HELO|nr:hypothetical protein HYFRA_00012088 [Hymenoscyphus fraxineus]